MSLRTRFKPAACIVGAVAAATLALGTTPAAASGTYSGLAYVYGADSYTDDWGNEGILSTGTNTNSNATCLWQKILWADGFLDSAADIDGKFGSYDVKGAADLGQLLPRTEEARSCFVSVVHSYAVGRYAHDADSCARAELRKGFVDGGMNVLDLLVRVAARDDFVKRQAP